MEKEMMHIEGCNEIYKHILATDARIVVCYGGRDSGKSYFVGGQYVPHLLCGEGNFRGMAVRKVHATHRDSCYAEVLDGIEMMKDAEAEAKKKRIKNAKRRARRKIEKEKAKIEQQEAERKTRLFGNFKKAVPKEVDEQKIMKEEMAKANKSMPTYGVKGVVSAMEIRHPRGNKLIFRGLDEPRKLKSLKGLNFIWVEEAEDLSREEFYELVMLLRGKGKQQIVLTFNPVDEGHFANGMFVESVADEVIAEFPNGEKKVWVKYLSAEVDGHEHRTKALCLRTTYEDNA